MDYIDGIIGKLTVL